MSAAATHTSHHDEPRVPVYVWDLVVRLTHWVIFATILVLSATGIYIGRPFGPPSGPATQSFIMGEVKVVHYWAAMAFSLAVLARMVWFFIGPRYATWKQLVPVTKRRLLDMWGTFRFYTFIDAEPPPAVGHNALAGAAYIGVFAMYLVMIFTGFAIYGASAHVDSVMRTFAWLLPLMGGAQSARWIHHVVMWLLLAFAVHHVYSATLMAKIEKNGTMDSIFGGYKVVPKSQLEDKSRAP